MNSRNTSGFDPFPKYIETYGSRSTSCEVAPLQHQIDFQKGLFSNVSFEALWYNLLRTYVWLLEPRLSPGSLSGVGDFSSFA